MKILVIGSGGREHALCWKLAQSASVNEVVCTPGNAGIASIARCINVDADNLPELLALAKKEQPQLIVIGPEVPLVTGLADQLRADGFDVFGPNQAAAELEGSKSFAKQLMQEAAVPTACFAIHNNAEAAEAYIRQCYAAGMSVVVKASGLAAGKGVIVAEHMDDAIAAANDMLSGNSFGEAGAQVVIEECLQGEEASCLFIVSGDCIVPLASSQDHKRLLDGDLGPNTGGMGAYSPAPCVTKKIANDVLELVARPIIKALKKRGIHFIGTLYAGMMITKDGIKTLEFNVRFGDPECQALLLRLQSDLAELLRAAAQGKLAQHPSLQWHAQTALCVVVASAGYPSSYEKNQIIGGLDAVADAGAIVFHAGTSLKYNNAENTKVIINTGGRVLGVTVLGSDILAAKQKVYSALEHLDWSGGFYRRDIGHHAL
ncbi:MAG: phosphoribosylamine--glycine ligase [Mariprofundales bacterium]